MDLVRLKSLAEFNKDSPPIHRVIANIGRYYGVVDPVRKPATDADFEQLMSTFPQAPQ